MIIKKVTLENYCQHKSREVEIQGNLIAVTGGNGRGKSNFLGAIQFALTGEQPDKTKDSLVHWGAKDGRVILDFEAEGRPGRITRPILSPKVTLEYDGETVTGITAVAKALDERLHVDRDLVRQSVFVRQKEIDAIISAKTDKRDREVAFQKLLGIDAAKLHKNLTDWMYGAMKPVNFDIQITEAEQRLGELETRVASLKADEEAAAKALADEGELTGDSSELQKAMAAVGAVLAAQDSLKAYQEAKEDADRSLAAVRACTGDAGENPGVDIAEKSAEVSALREELAKARALTRATVEVDAAREALKKAESLQSVQAAGKHPTDEELAALEAVVSDRREKLAVLRSAATAHRKALESLSGGETVCPVCGKPLDGDAETRLRTELSRMQAESDAVSSELSKAVGDHARMKSERDGWEHGRAMYEAEVTYARKALSSAEDRRSACAMPAVDAATAEAGIREAEDDILRQKEYDDKVAGRARAVKEAEVRADACAETLAGAKTALLDAIATAVKVCGPEAAADWSAAQSALQGAVDGYNMRRERIQSIRITLEKAKATHGEAVRTLEATRRTVADLKERQRKQDEIAKRLATLERVRDWLHYANGPRVLVRQVLDALTDDVNRFLGNFTAPFVVAPNDEDLGFIVTFTDGRDRPEKPQTTAVLSGGELVQLAVAFRFAVYAMFSGKLGLLSLDEPMAFLDRNNIGRFGVFLMKVREITRNMHVQVFIATHQEVVIPHMDSVIDLN